MKVVFAKLVILGDRDVGKTSTIIRYVKNTFATCEPTVGVSFFTCKIQVGSITVKLQVWDTAGSERYHAMAPLFYRNASAAVFMFDITSRPSFISLKEWVVEMKDYIEESVLFYVVGNKLDLANDRQVTEKEAAQYAKNIGASYHECSAREGQGVDVVFEDIAAGLCSMASHNNHTLKIYENDEKIVVGKEEVHCKKRNSKCCLR